jgi:hypothetical protein
VSTIGVDLAAQRGNTAAAVVVWGDAGGRCTGDDIYEGLADEDIVTLVGRHPDARMGIDAPFGWPAFFLDTVARWDEEDVWPDEIDLHQLRFRYTDRFVREQVGWYPLSVSTDLISITAFRCARLLRQLAGDTPICRVDGRVVEVYPAAALAVWGLPHKNYKGPKPPAVAQRRRILKALVDKAPLNLANEVVERCIASDHVLDGLICAMIARATELDATHRPPDAHADLIRREGWIELPLPASLESMGRQTAWRRVIGRPPPIGSFSAASESRPSAWGCCSRRWSPPGRPPWRSLRRTAPAGRGGHRQDGGAYLAGGLGACG